MAINLAGSGQQLDTSLPTIYEEFRLTRDETGVCRKVAFALPLKAQTGASKHIIDYGRLTAYDLPDGVDMVQHQGLADNLTSYTPGEVGVQVILPRTTLRRIADPDLLRRTGRMMAMAYDVKEDNDGCSQFSSFTPIVGAAGYILGPGYMMAAIARLGIANNRTFPESPPKPWNFVLNPLSLSALAGNLIPLGTTPSGTTGYTGLTATGQAIAQGSGQSALASKILDKGPEAIANFMGVPVFTDANIDVDSSDDASGAVFSKDAFIYVSEWEPEMMNEAEDKSMRALELNLVGSYAWGLWRADGYGCEMLFDASLPTG